MSIQTWMQVVLIRYGTISLSGLIVTLAMAVPSSSSSSTKSGTGTNILQLQNPHPTMDPCTTLQYLSNQCNVLGVKQWDIYGDFDSSYIANTNKNTEDDDDDVSFLRKFEKEIASEFGKDDGVYMPSGVMAQSIALLIHRNTAQHKNHPNDKKKNNDNEIGMTKRRNQFICHASSHLLLHEQDGYRELCDMEAISLPRNEPGVGFDASPLLFRHIEELVSSSSSTITGDSDDKDNDPGEVVETSAAATTTNPPLESVSTLILELPHRELGGKITPWEDIIQMKQFCTQHGIAFHCDGARIFEATTAYTNHNHNHNHLINEKRDEKSKELLLSELTKPFDSVYVSFYKGLGGISGAMLLGTTEFCKEARVWLRRFGGNLYTLLPYAVSGWEGYRKYWKDAQASAASSSPSSLTSSSDRVLTFQEKKQKIIRIVSAISNHEHSSTVLAFEPSIPQTNMVHCYIRIDTERCSRIRDEIQESLGVSIFKRIRPIDDNNDNDLTYNKHGFHSKLEIAVGEANGNINDDIWIEAWTEFCTRAVQYC